MSASPAIAHPSLLPAVDAAIAGAIDHLSHRQSPDGAWRSSCDQGPAVTAQAAIVLAWVDQIDDGLAAAICRGLEARQLADGGWPMLAVGGASDLGATATCWAALVRLGHGESAAARAGKRYVDDHGGLEALSGRIREADASAWYVAMAGLLDGRRLPRVPLAWRQSARVRRWLQSRVHDGIQLLGTELGAIARRLSGDWALPPQGRSAADAAAVVALHDDYRNPDGSWCGFVPIHCLALAAMYACGDRGDRVRAGVAWLRARLAHDERGAWFTAYDPDIWVTGITMRALLLAGVPPADPRIRGGVDWLLQSQVDRPQAIGLQRRPGALRVGGWAFGGGNPVMPDTDDTGIALLALARSGGEGVEASIARGVEWLRGFQNEDGSIPAFTWNLGRLPEGGALRFHPEQDVGWRERVRRVRDMLPMLGDPPSPDLCGRLLVALGALGLPQDDPLVAGQVRWLRQVQQPNGSWWGKWVTPYVVTTADVLHGLHAAGLPAADPAVQRGLAWLLARQQPEGGWGDPPAAHLDPARAGRGPSNCPTTAWVLSGLLPWLGAHHPAMLAGVSYLLERQQPDGDWPNGAHSHVYLPPDRVYVLPASAAMHGLEALARWRDAATA